MCCTMVFLQRVGSEEPETVRVAEPAHTYGRLMRTDVQGGYTPR
jgi:hypothetical protein